MRFTSVPIVLFALLLLAGPAVAGTLTAGETSLQTSTDEVTCSEEATCDGPSATARVQAGPPDSDEEAKVRCAKDVFGDQHVSEHCDPEHADVDPGMLRAYVGVDGLDATQQDSRSSYDDQDAETSSANDGMLGLDAETVALIGALGLGASGAAAFVGLRRIATFLLAPLASRLKRSELLDNDTRRAIYEKISDDPGINLRALSDELDVAWGTLLHHLRKLEDGHLVVSDRYGKYRRYFLNGSTYTKEEQARLAALSTPSTARVAEYILDHPGSNQSEIGDALDVTASTILFHVRRLKEVGLVEQERDGRYVHYYPAMKEHETEHLAVA